MKHQEYIECEGREIAVQELEGIGDDYYEGRLYMDAQKNIYLTEMQSEMSLDDAIKRLGGEISLPRDRRKVDEYRKPKNSTRRISEQTALAWYAQEFMNLSPLRDLMRKCVADFVPKSERAGKMLVKAWVPKSIQKQVSEQLELSIMEAMERRKPAKRVRVKKAPTGEGSPRHFQLEMTTALVSTVMQFASKPDVEHLMEARREVSKFHSHIHSETALKLATAN